MRKSVSFFAYSILGAFVFYIDRITKAWAMNNARDSIEINQFLSFDLVVNRGVTAGMLQSENPIWFTILSIIIGAIIVGLALYTCYRWHYGHNILGEMLTIAGAASNLLDRYWFQGVIDFIHVTFLEYSFPVFNCADIGIVLGVAIMFYLHWREDVS